MAGAKATFSKVSQVIQSEHQELMQRLSQLDTALDELVCYSEVYADLTSAERVYVAGRWLSEWLPNHFVHEEGTVLTSLSKLGPEGAGFAREMKRQHKEIGTLLKAFCKEMNHLQDAEDLEQSIGTLKQKGKDLTSFMAVHMGAEERQFASIKS